MQMSLEAKMVSDLLRLSYAVMGIRPLVRLSMISRYVTESSPLLVQYRDGTRVGRRLTGKMYDDAMQSFSDNWPDGLAWPADIDRPKQQPEEKRTKWPPTPRRRLTAEERDAMAAAYVRGEPIKAIAHRFDVDDSYPTQMAKRRGLELRGQNGSMG